MKKNKNYLENQNVIKQTSTLGQNLLNGILVIRCQINLKQLENTDKTNSLTLYYMTSISIKKLMYMTSLSCQMNQRILFFSHDSCVTQA